MVFVNSSHISLILTDKEFSYYLDKCLLLLNLRILCMGNGSLVNSRRGVTVNPTTSGKGIEKLCIYLLSAIIRFCQESLIFSHNNPHIFFKDMRLEQ